MLHSLTPLPQMWAEMEVGVCPLKENQVFILFFTIRMINGWILSGKNKQTKYTATQKSITERFLAMNDFVIGFIIKDKP